MLKMAEISSGRSLKPNTPREPKLGYVLWLQRLNKAPGNAVGGKGLMKLALVLWLLEKPVCGLWCKVPVFSHVRICLPSYSVLEQLGKLSSALDKRVITSQ